MNVCFLPNSDSINKAFISIKDTNDVKMDFSFLYHNKTLNITSPLASKKEYKIKDENDTDIWVAHNIEYVAIGFQNRFSKKWYYIQFISESNKNSKINRYKR